MRTPSPSACIVALALLPACTEVADAQVPRSEVAYSPLELLSGNLIVSGLGAAIVGRFEGRPFWKTFVHGAAGGAVSFLGKRISASNPEALGFAGRQISAVGASIARSAAFGSGILDTLFIPVGPVRLAWTPRDGGLANLRVDVEDVAWAAYGLLDDRYAFDASRSLAAGALVFTTNQHIGEENGGTVSGFTGGGAVFLSEPQLTSNPGNRHHELVHVAQTDYLEIAFGAPLEGWILRGLGWADLSAFRHLDLGFGHYPLQALLRPALEDEAGRFEARIR